MTQPLSDKPIACWLFACAFLVALMVMLGGYTRLSGSGLSITEWKPVHGVLPPLSDAEWQEEFAAYKQSPQYQKINHDMELDAFKTIYWPEYFHRLLGRTVGVVFFTPFLFFLSKKRLGRALTLRLLVIFALGSLQGAVGWLMVKSGLVDQPYVSHLRLAAHLALAFLIFGLLLWTALDLTPKKSSPILPRRAKKAFTALVVLLFLQVILGAFMAGLHAGLVYNTFPMLNDDWIPPEALSSSSAMEALHNIALIQLFHRWTAVLLLILAGFWWLRFGNYARGSNLGKTLIGAGALLVLQFMLGVATLLAQVPLPLALLHQFIALLLFGAAVTALHELQERERNE